MNMTQDQEEMLGKFQLDHLASHDPEKLFRLVESSSLPAGLLTHAAEACGRTQRPDRARRVLLPLLKHPSPVVREGAIYGLELLGDDDEVRTTLTMLTLPTHEPSPGVRSAAREALELLRDQEYEHR